MVTTEKSSIVCAEEQWIDTFLLHLCAPTVRGTTPGRQGLCCERSPAWPAPGSVESVGLRGWNHVEHVQHRRCRLDHRSDAHSVVHLLLAQTA